MYHYKLLRTHLLHDPIHTTATTTTYSLHHMCVPSSESTDWHEYRLRVCVFDTQTRTGITTNSMMFREALTVLSLQTTTCTACMHVCLFERTAATTTNYMTQQQAPIVYQPACMHASAPAHLCRYKPLQTIRTCVPTRTMALPNFMRASRHGSLLVPLFNKLHVLPPRKRTHSL